MASLAELNRIQAETLLSNNLSPERKGVRVVVGMASCGIAAGARPVFEALAEAIAASGARGATVAKTGCIGMCRLEPLVEVTRPNEPKVTYVKVTRDMVGRIVSEHVIGGRPVEEYAIGADEA